MIISENRKHLSEIYVKYVNIIYRPICRFFKTLNSQFGITVFIPIHFNMSYLNFSFINMALEIVNCIYINEKPLNECSPKKSGTDWVHKLLLAEWLCLYCRLLDKNYFGGFFGTSAPILV